MRRLLHPNGGERHLRSALLIGFFESTLDAVPEYLEATANSSTLVPEIYEFREIQRPRCKSPRITTLQFVEESVGILYTASFNESSNLIATETVYRKYPERDLRCRDIFAVMAYTCW